MIHGLPFPGFKPSSHCDARKRRQPDRVVEAAVIGIGRKSDYLEGINVDVERMYSVGVVNDAPLFGGSDFYGPGDSIFLITLPIHPVLKSIDDSLAAGFHRECHDTSRHNLGVADGGYSRLGIGSLSGIAICLGSPETSNAAISMSGVAIISPIASLIRFGDVGIWARA